MLLCTTVDPGVFRMYHDPLSFFSEQDAPDTGGVSTDTFCDVPSTIDAQPDNKEMLKTSVVVAMIFFIFYFTLFN